MRFLAEEQTLFELELQLTPEERAETLLVRKLAPLADLYICDTFAAARRDQPSLCGFEQVLSSAIGRLFEQEYCVVSGLMEQSERPCTFALGEAKILDAFLMLRTVLEKGAADRIFTGGLVGDILLAAKGEGIGASSLTFIEKSDYTGFIETARVCLRSTAIKLCCGWTLRGWKTVCAVRL